MSVAVRIRRSVSRHGLPLAVLVTAALLAACNVVPQAAPAPGNPGAATMRPIKIGYLAHANCPSAPIGAGMHPGTDIAVEQINAAGGIHGRTIQVTYVDPLSDPTQAVQMATELVQNDRVDVLLGGVLSSECLVLQQLAAKLQIVYMPTFGCAAEE